MDAQLQLQRILQSKLSELRSRNPQFSIRAFARRLGMQASATNELLKGERTASRQLAERIADRLHLDPTEKFELLKCFPQRVRRKKGADPQAQRDYLRLNSDQFSILSDWTHYAILSLIRTADFQSDPEWIANRLGVKKSKIASGLERLERLALIENKNGKWKRTYARVDTPDDVANPSLQQSHIGDMELAKESILRDPVRLRDFTSMTMPTSVRLLPKAKEIIRAASDEIANLLSSEPSEEVYRLSVNLFPLSRLKKESHYEEL